MENDYNPPVSFRPRQQITRETPPRWRREEWVPTPEKTPIGPSPQAVRLIRLGQPAETLRLITAQAYHVGRNDSDCQLLFSDQRVSRQHGVLYFVPLISGWAFKDTDSTFGTGLSTTDRPSEWTKLEPAQPIGIVAGQVLALAKSANRLEFLERVPAAVTDASGRVNWKSPASRDLETQVQEAARKSGQVLLFGESGSGKTYLAQRIHELSGRTGPYVYLNCGLVSTDSTRFQSEMLGHVKGAFTGAQNSRSGKLFLADKGTMFLDEVESLPPESQVFFLDLLEGKDDLSPLGSDRGRPRPDVRFICATKKPLDETPLREDLVNRLVRGHPIVIPTLAERREDIPILVGNILDELRRGARVRATVPDEAMAFLMAQPWPGHIRQLRALLDDVTDGHQGEHRVLELKLLAAYLARTDRVRGRRNWFAPALREPDDDDPRLDRPGSETIEMARKRPADMRREDIERALRAANGVVKRAAQLLGCSPTTLREKRREFGV